MWKKILSIIPCVLTFLCVFWLIFIAVTYVAITLTAEVPDIEPEDKPDVWRWDIVDFSGHQYVRARWYGMGNHQGTFVHSPDCPCKRGAELTPFGW